MKSASGLRRTLLATCLVLSGFGAHAQDPVDTLIAQLEPAQRQALLDGADPATLKDDKGVSLLDAVKSLIQLVEVTRVYFSGQSVLIPNANPNDAVWFFNNPDHLWGQLSELSATIVHDGFLNGPHGLDHIAISVRGASMEGLLQQIGPSSASTWRFTFGEHVSAAVAAGTVGMPQLRAALSGRGPTFWPVGAGVCSTAGMPCMVFENYTVNLDAPGLVCANNAWPCSAAVALPLGTGPFQVHVSADAWDTRTIVTQNGWTLANVSCRAISGGDARCGAQPGDQADGDAFIANVVADSGSGWSGRQLGALDVTVRVLRQVPGWSTCPDCFEP